MGTPLCNTVNCSPAFSPILYSHLQKPFVVSIWEHFQGSAVLISSLVSLGFSFSRSAKSVSTHPSAWQLLKLSIVPKMYWNVKWVIERWGLILWISKPDTPMRTHLPTVFSVSWPSPKLFREWECWFERGNYRLFNFHLSLWLNNRMWKLLVRTINPSLLLPIESSLVCLQTVPLFGPCVFLVSISPVPSMLPDL